MKMLNALEALPRRRARAPSAVVREGLSILLRVLYPVVPHIGVRAVARTRVRARARRLCSTRRGRRSIAAALAQDEIELVLQVNGKLRGKIVVPATRRSTRRSRRRRAQRPKWRSTRDGAAGEESRSSCPGGSSMSWSRGLALRSRPSRCSRRACVRLSSARRRRSIRSRRSCSTSATTHADRRPSSAAASRPAPARKRGRRSRRRGRSPSTSPERRRRQGPSCRCQRRTRQRIRAHQARVVRSRDSRGQRLAAAPARS